MQPPPAIIRGGGIGEPDLLGNYTEYVCFTHVDGKPTVSSLARAFFLGAYPREVLVAPGSHSVTVRYVVRHNFASGDAWIDAHPGRIYLITPERQDERTRLLILDITRRERESAR